MSFAFLLNMGNPRVRTTAIYMVNEELIVPVESDKNNNCHVVEINVCETHERPFFLF